MEEGNRPSFSYMTFLPLTSFFLPFTLIPFLLLTGATAITREDRIKPFRTFVSSPAFRFRRIPSVENVFETDFLWIRLMVEKSNLVASATAKMRI